MPVSTNRAKEHTRVTVVILEASEGDHLEHLLVEPRAESKVSNRSGNADSMAAYALVVHS